MGDGGRRKKMHYTRDGVCVSIFLLPPPAWITQTPLISPALGLISQYQLPENRGVTNPTNAKDVAAADAKTRTHTHLVNLSKFRLTHFLYTYSQCILRVSVRDFKWPRWLWAGQQEMFLRLFVQKGFDRASRYFSLSNNFLYLMTASR